jgi:hypothetical protein
MSHGWIRVSLKIFFFNGNRMLSYGVQQLENCPSNVMELNFPSLRSLKGQSHEMCTIGLYIYIKHIPLGHCFTSEVFFHIALNLPRYSNMKLTQRCQQHRRVKIVLRQPICMLVSQKPWEVIKWFCVNVSSNKNWGFFKFGKSTQLSTVPCSQ